MIKNFKLFLLEDIKLNDITDKIANKQNGIDQKEKESDKLEKDLKNIIDTGINTPSDENRTDRIEQQLDSLSDKISKDTEEMNSIYNTYTKSATSNAPILGKTIGNMDNLESQDDDKKGYVR